MRWGKEDERNSAGCKATPGSLITRYQRGVLHQSNPIWSKCHSLSGLYLEIISQPGPHTNAPIAPTWPYKACSNHLTVNWACDDQTSLVGIEIEASAFKRGAYPGGKMGPAAGCEQKCLWYTRNRVSPGVRNRWQPRQYASSASRMSRT